MKKINSEVGNLVSELKGVTSGAADALGAVSGKIDSLVGNVTDKISGLPNRIFRNDVCYVLVRGVCKYFVNVRSWFYFISYSLSSITYH